MWNITKVNNKRGLDNVNDIFVFIVNFEYISLQSSFEVSLTVRWMQND